MCPQAVTLLWPWGDSEGQAVRLLWVEASPAVVTGRPWGRGQCRSRDSAFAAPAPLRRPSGCRSLLECCPKHGSLRPPQPLGSQHRHPQRRPLPRRHHRWDSGLCRDSTASLTQGTRSPFPDLELGLRGRSAGAAGRSGPVRGGPGVAGASGSA